jgi:EmrB/QacA subfamily drug resistance transporter
MSAPSAPATDAIADPAPGRLDPGLIRLIIVLLAGAIPSLLDTSIVNVAIPAIAGGLHTSVSSVQWVITGYLLAFAMVIPLSTWALARFGGRAAWMSALALFLAGSVACGAAWNVASLIAFRVAQGAGAGMMAPLVTTLLMQAAGGRQIGRLMSAVSLPVVIVPILGPVVSGLIVANVSWRWIFYVNVPVCLAGLVLAWRGLPSRPAGTRERFDVGGLLLLSPALAGLLYGLAQASIDGGFGHLRVIIPLAAGTALLAGFVWHALRTASPLVDLRLLRVRAFAAASSVLFLAGLSLFGAMLLMPLYFQEVRGYSALTAGLLLVPQGVGSLVPRTLAGRLTDRIGPRLVTVAGIVAAAVGTIPFALAGPHTSNVLLGAALVIRGAGLGTATIAVTAGAFQGLNRSQIPHASSVVRIVMQVGGSFGAAVLVAVILGGQVAGHAGAGTDGLALAFGHTFWWCVGFTVLALVPALLLAGRTAPAAGGGPA